MQRGAPGPELISGHGSATGWRSGVDLSLRGELGLKSESRNYLRRKAQRHSASRHAGLHCGRHRRSGHEARRPPVPAPLTTCLSALLCRSPVVKPLS